MALVSLASVVGVAYAVWPHILIVGRGPIDAEDPFSARFEVRNDGWLPMRDVQFYCYTPRMDITNRKGATLHYYEEDTRHYNRKPILSISGGDADTAHCWRGIGFTDGSARLRPDSATMRVGLDFHVWILPRRFTKEFEFAMVTTPTGESYWERRAVQD